MAGLLICVICIPSNKDATTHALIHPNKLQIAQQFWATKPRRDFLITIRAIESNDNYKAVGASGELGAYQISRAYWLDSGVSGNWEDVRDNAYAEAVMFWYFTRYASEALWNDDFEHLAKLHNGGPSQTTTRDVQVYWDKVQSKLSPKGIELEH